MSDKDVLLNKVLLQIREDIVSGDPSYIMKILNEHVPHKYLYEYVNRDKGLNALTDHLQSQVPESGLEDTYKYMNDAIDRAGRKDEE